MICISIRLVALREGGNADGEGWQGTGLRACEVLARQSLIFLCLEKRDMRKTVRGACYVNA